MIPKKVFSDNLRLFSRFSKNKVPFVENSSPDISIEEARADVAPFLETNRTTVAIFGLKIPYFLALEPWIQQSAGHQLVFLEDDLEVFSAFLTKEEASSLLAHPQVSIALLSQSDDENAPSLSRLSNDFYFFSAKSHLSRSGPVYAKLLQDVYAIRAYLAKIVLYKNDAHFYRHLAALNEGSFFKESMPQVPFVICGAGPSLQEDMDELKGLMVLASGTAMNILNDAGIQADLGVAFDFHPAAMRRLSANNAFLTPFFVDLDSSFEGARYLHGRKFLTLTDPASWKWNMLKAFKVEDAIIKLPASITSTHYALNAALRLKSPAQMLLGVDLAYLKGRQYAGRKTWISDEDDPTPLSQRTDLIEIKDALMSRTYQAEAAIFAHMVREHPEIQYFYGSKLSRGINGIPYLRHRAGR